MPDRYRLRQAVRLQNVEHRVYGGLEVGEVSGAVAEDMFTGVANPQTSPRGADTLDGARASRISASSNP